MTKQTRLYCGDCRRFVLAEREPMNHVLHLLLTIVTFWMCGGWLWVWLLLSVTHSSRSRCQRCGSVELSRDEPDMVEVEAKEGSAPPRPHRHRVTVDTRSPVWPQRCACCLKPADRKIAITATRDEGVMVVREKKQTATEPYCTPCMGHLSRLPDVRREIDLADRREDERHEDVMRLKKRAAELEQASERPGALAPTAGIGAALLAVASIILFVVVGREKGVPSGIAVFLALVACAAVFAWAAFVALPLEDRRRRDRLAADAERCLQEVDDLVEADQRERAADTRRCDALAGLSADCRTVREAVNYDGWDGRLHTFSFANQCYADLFREANAGRVVG